ncbi:hypothetical protein H5410_051150 [Solanum commersonii]|uniref:Endonuclease/exonuclease/phosphatase domain-containing protein n=1 Tax=Solanum commersonii TaxID=4109 RepID=A0A9J5WXJ8_SOLCO|nr:hypothetical protein H5410_051150 [Solanum commersonii]
MGMLKHLEILMPHINRIKGLLTTMESLSQLWELDVSFNEVENIPKTFCLAINMEKLNLANNFADLRTLPRSIGNLENLEELDITNSQIIMLLDSFRLLSKLEIFRADETPLEITPRQIIKLGDQAIFMLTLLRRSSDQRRSASSLENQSTTGRHFRSGKRKLRRPEISRGPAPTGERRASLSVLLHSGVDVNSKQELRRATNSGEGKVSSGELFDAGDQSDLAEKSPSFFSDQNIGVDFKANWLVLSGFLSVSLCRFYIRVSIFLVDLVHDGGIESCLRLRPRKRDSRGKRVTGSLNLRVGSWNIGSLTGKSIELVKILKKRKINIACVQETRWVGAKARVVDGFKLWYSGGSKDRNGVGILVDGDLREQVVEVRRINDRLMMVKLVIGGCTLSVISAYAPQVGLEEEAKKLFYEDLDEVVRGIPNTERIVIGGDFNGHIGATSNGFDDVHGGFGFGERNGGGTSLIDFAKAFELVIANSCFPKKENHLVTFRSSVAKTQIDYFLLRKGDRGLCKLTTQHK